jgi:hypothetical protein
LTARLHSLSFGTLQSGARDAHCLTLRFCHAQRIVE